MQRIEDESLALKLREKVQEFNGRGLLVPAAATAAFVLLPEAAGLLLAH